MTLIKKATAILLSIVMLVSFSGCGKSTSWAMKYGDYEAKAGVLLYYQMQAYNEALDKAKKENPDLDTADLKAVQALNFEGLPIKEWINNQVADNLRKYLAVQSKFDEYDLSLTDDEVSEVDENFEMYWSYFEEMFTKNGIGKESYKDIMTLTYKSNALFKHFYAKGGLEEYPEEDLENYYEENYARVKYIALNLTDSSGSEYDQAKKDEVKKMAEDYIKRAKKGEEFDSLIKEYNDYYQALSAENTTDENAELSTNSLEELTEETTTTESEEDSSVETTVSGEEDSDATSTSTSEESDDSSETTTIKNENEDEDDTITSIEETEDDTVTTTEDEDATTTSEETADPYVNDQIIAKGKDDSYNPSQVVNEAIFNDAKVDGDPIFVEDKENLKYYVVVRLDIMEREDLWTDEYKVSLLLEILGDEYDEKLLSFATLEAINRNERAFKRYDPFNLKFE